MPPTLIWDLPTRLFHWLLAGGFGAAAFIALALGEDSPLFPYHGLIGLTLAVMVGLRLIWGVIGTRYARFGSFAFGPGAVVGYFKDILRGVGTRHAGHNPASAYAIFAILALLAGMCVTGVMLGRGNEGVKEVHEVCAYALLAVVGVHVLGVVLHTLRTRENITGGMIHGRKQADPAAGIPSARPIAAVLFLVITGAWAASLVRNYEPATRTARVPLLDVSLQMAEAESEGERASGARRERDHDDD